MREFIPSILIHVGGHIPIEHHQGPLKGGVSQGQFVVLLPKVRFKDLRCREKSQNRRVSVRQVLPAAIALSTIVSAIIASVVCFGQILAGN